MFNKVLLISTKTILGKFLNQSLAAEGYEVAMSATPAAAHQRASRLDPDLILVNGVGKQPEWLGWVDTTEWPAPAIILVDEKNAGAVSEAHLCLKAPFAFQDLLLLAQDFLYQKEQGGRPFQLPAWLLDDVEAILDVLREDLRARGVILSTSSGRLIKTAGVVEQGDAISLAALMAAGFSATARAAQMLGQGEMFDSSLQESEGYGLYAIRLQDKLILSVAFSDQITVGMVRHRTAQATVDILELLARETERNGFTQDWGLDNDFYQDASQALNNLLRD